jgi:hypothetical protein
VIPELKECVISITKNGDPLYKSKCSIPGCTKYAVSFGYCSKDYKLMKSKKMSNDSSLFEKKELHVIAVPTIFLVENKL